MCATTEYPDSSDAAQDLESSRSNYVLTLMAVLLAWFAPGSCRGTLTCVWIGFGWGRVAHVSLTSSPAMASIQRQDKSQEGQSLGGWGVSQPKPCWRVTDDIGILWIGIYKDISSHLIISIIAADSSVVFLNLSFPGSNIFRGQDSSVGKSLDLRSKDCRFEPRCRRGVFLVRVFSKLLTSNC